MTSPTTPNSLLNRLREAAGMQDYNMGNSDWLSALLTEAADALSAVSESGRNIIVPPEVIEAAEWYAGVPARAGKMSDFILKLAKDKA